MRSIHPSKETSGEISFSLQMILRVSHHSTTASKWRSTSKFWIKDLDWILLLLDKISSFQFKLMKISKWIKKIIIAWFTWRICYNITIWIRLKSTNLKLSMNVKVSYQAQLIQTIDSFQDYHLIEIQNRLESLAWWWFHLTVEGEFQIMTLNNKESSLPEKIIVLKLIIMQSTLIGFNI